MFNLITAADAYTIAGNCLISDKGKQRSVYYMANRTSPTKAWPEVATDDRMVMWGISQFIESMPRINAEDILEATEFMNQAHVFNKPLKFDMDMWMRVLREYEGYLPIKIESIPDGAVFYPHQPMIQVTSLDEGFGECAAHIEALLVGMVSIGTARATLTAHLYDFMVKQFVQYGEKYPEACDKARNAIHDFGMRASSCFQESELMGMAHLLFFNGTDTFNAASKVFRLAKKDNKNIGYGKSILALAHRIVQSYNVEGNSYSNLHTQDTIGSYVADCYDFKRAVKEHLIPLALNEPLKLVVVRPDSGDAIENTLFVAREAKAAGLYQDAIGGLLPMNLTMIEGNTVRPQTIDAIYKALHAEGFNPTKWIMFGIGGWLRNSCTRDSLSSAYKLSSIGVDNQRMPVMKFSETEEKQSIPGPVRLNNRCCEKKWVFEDEKATYKDEIGLNENGFVTYYDASNVNVLGSPYFPKFIFRDYFGEARDRANYQWTRSEKHLSRTEIVGEMKDVVNALKRKYKG